MPWHAAQDFLLWVWSETSEACRPRDAAIHAAGLHNEKSLVSMACRAEATAYVMKVQMRALFWQ